MIFKVIFARKAGFGTNEAGLVHSLLFNPACLRSQRFLLVSESLPCVQWCCSGKIPWPSLAAKLKAVVIMLTGENETFSFWGQRWSSGLIGNMRVLPAQSVHKPRPFSLLLLQKCAAAGAIITWGSRRTAAARWQRLFWPELLVQGHWTLHGGGAVVCFTVLLPPPSLIGSTVIHLYLSLVHSFCAAVVRTAFPLRPLLTLGFFCECHGSHTVVLPLSWMSVLGVITSLLS